MDSLQKAVYGCMQKLSLGIVWRELQVLSKLLYKGRNQHRRDKAFQMLLRVSKDLQKYQAVCLSNIVKKTWKSLLDCKVLSRAGMQSIGELFDKLIECAQYTAQTISFVETTFNQVNQRLSMSLFIPFNLLMVSSLSRIWYCLRYHLLAISETFSIVKSHLPPNHKLSPAESILSCLPPIHQHYLTEAPSLSGDGLGTAVPRLDYTYTDSECKQSVVKTARSTGTVSSVQEQDFPKLKTALSDQELNAPVLRFSAVCADVKTKKAPVVKNPPTKRRRPNSMLCFVKAGRKVFSAKVRCPSYLKTARLLTVYKVRLSHVRSMRKTPWQVTAHKVSLQRLSNRTQRHNAPAVPSQGRKKLSKVQRLSNRTQRHNAPAVPSQGRKKLSKVQPQNDIDDIFSALNV